MYMRKEDGEPPLSVVTEERGDDQFTKVIKSIIIKATQVDPKERTSAENVYQKLTALAIKQVSKQSNI